MNQRKADKISYKMVYLVNLYNFVQGSSLFILDYQTNVMLDQCSVDERALNESVIDESALDESVVDESTPTLKMTHTIFSLQSWFQYVVLGTSITSEKNVYYPKKRLLSKQR